MNDYSQSNTDKTNTSTLKKVIGKFIVWALYAIVIMIFWNGTITKFFPEIVMLTWHDSFFGVLSLEVISNVLRY